MIIIFIGPPGAGKGTQAKLLSQKYHLSHFSIGKILREEYEKGTKEGITAWRYWGKKGINVPSRISFILLKKYLAGKSGFILDNFPRTKENLVELKKYLKERNLVVDFVFHLGVGQKEITTRLLKRAENDQKITGKTRLDETKSLIKTRLKIGYKKEIGDILNYFNKLKVLFYIDGSQSISSVNQAVNKIIENHD